MGLESLGIKKEKLKGPLLSGHLALLTSVATTIRKTHKTSASVDIEPLPTCTHMIIWYMTQKTYIFLWNVHIGNLQVAARLSAFVQVKMVRYP